MSDVVEAAIKSELTVKMGEHEFVFKIPSLKDRLNIATKAVKLRQENDPDGSGLGLGYDPTTVVLTDKIATFMVLLKSTTAPWVYCINEKGQPGMDLDKWPDNVPIMEVVDQFNDELAKFRETGN